MFQLYRGATTLCYEAFVATEGRLSAIADNEEGRRLATDYARVSLAFACGELVFGHLAFFLYAISITGG
jgi:hypothetical protein